MLLQCCLSDKINLSRLFSFFFFYLIVLILAVRYYSDLVVFYTYLTLCF